jgi:phenylpyruvate tautomerase PptA (4-oxalocrotonate tautomerase family)
MPISFLEVPTGAPTHVKQRLVDEISSALDEAYRVPDTRIFIHEWPLENLGQDGRHAAEPARPICFLEVPPGVALEAKREMFRRINAAIAEAYHRPSVLIFMREYPLELVSLDGGLQSENPELLDALAKVARH